MGILKQIFEREPGGTKLGNTLRNVANKMSNGILGNGMFKVDENGNGLFYKKDGAKKMKGEFDPSAQNLTPAQQKDFLGLTSSKNAEKKTWIAVGITAGVGLLLAGIAWARKKMKENMPRRKR